MRLAQSRHSFAMPFAILCQWTRPPHILRQWTRGQSGAHDRAQAAERARSFRLEISRGEVGGTGARVHRRRSFELRSAHHRAHNGQVLFSSARTSSSTRRSGFVLIQHRQKDAQHLLASQLDSLSRHMVSKPTSSRPQRGRAATTRWHGPDGVGRWGKSATGVATQHTATSPHTMATPPGAGGSATT